MSDYNFRTTSVWHLPKMRKEEKEKMIELVYFISITILRGIEWIRWPTFFCVFHNIQKYISITAQSFHCWKLKGFEGAYQRYEMKKVKEINNCVNKEYLCKYHIEWNVQTKPKSGVYYENVERKYRTKY